MLEKIPEKFEKKAYQVFLLYFNSNEETADYLGVSEGYVIRRNNYYNLKREGHNLAPWIMWTHIAGYSTPEEMLKRLIKTMSQRQIAIYLSGLIPKCTITIQGIRGAMVRWNIESPRGRGGYNGIRRGIK